MLTHLKNEENDVWQSNQYYIVIDIFHSGLQPLSHDRLVGFLVFRPATTYHPVLEVNMEVIEMQEHIVAWLGPIGVYNGVK